jgi:predicted CXXCH cytochrome family protein
VRTTLRTVIAFAAAPAATLLALAFGPDPTRIEASRPLHARDADYEGSSSCRTCHPEHHESWSRTYHRTMTQLPTPAAVLGRFDGEPVEFYGRRAIPFESEGRFHVRLPDGAGERVAEVALCVGSRRYQQYFELEGSSEGDVYRRLPILWHVGERRWMHLNGVFLHPDDPDWGAHAATWNDNCIFCHNTAPEPRGDFSGASKTFDSRVAELGIACEACHGPGEEHVARLASPLERVRATDDARDLAIVDPSELGQMEALALCGQCHSQRLPSPLSRIGEFLDRGPSFRPGDPLEEHVAPLTRDTPPLSADHERLFRDRFWADGTARLTAYEYLGITQSPCLAGGEMTCNSCHSMHAGDVEGNLEPEMRGDAACTQCHEGIARDVRAHTHHDPAGSGSRCLDCHMPRIAYGILDIHRSHRIEVPDVARDVEAGRPNACTGCHLDRTAGWAADAMRERWGESYRRPATRPDGAPLDVPEALASLHAGDAVQRAVAAWQFGRPEAALEPSGKAVAFAHLVVALGDGYPSLRTLARRSLKSLDAELGLGLAAQIEAFDTFAPLEVRQLELGELLASFRGAARGRVDAPGPGSMLSSDFELDLGRVRALLELQSDHVIAIGE